MQVEAIKIIQDHLTYRLVLTLLLDLSVFGCGPSAKSMQVAMLRTQSSRQLRLICSKAESSACHAFGFFVCKLAGIAAASAASACSAVYPMTMDAFSMGCGMMPVGD